MLSIVYSSVRKLGCEKRPNLAEADHQAEPNQLLVLCNDPGSTVNSEMDLTTLQKLGPIPKRRENLMDNAEFYELIRRANANQKALCIHIINQLIPKNTCPMQIFLTGPAGSGKLFTIRLLIEIYNRFTDSDGYCDAYIT